MWVKKALERMGGRSFEGFETIQTRLFQWGVDSVHCVRFNPVETSLLGAAASDRSIILYDTRETRPMRKGWHSTGFGTLVAKGCVSAKFKFAQPLVTLIWAQNSSRASRLNDSCSSKIALDVIVV